MPLLSEFYKNRLQQLAGILNEAGVDAPQAQPQQVQQQAPQAQAPQQQPVQQQVQQPVQQQQPAQQSGIDLKKAGEFVNKLLQSYKFHVFYPKSGEERNVISQIIKGYQDGQGVLPNNLQGGAMIEFVGNNKGANISLVSSNKVLIKQIMDKVNASWSNFSTSQNKQLGHNQAQGWNNTQTNVGSKGSQAASKENISSPEYLGWNDKTGKRNPLFLGTITLY